jgi:hypothetical protein
MPTNQTWDQYGFVPVSSVVKPRLIAAVCGLEKTGKNHFAFTAPDPIALLSLDFGDEGMVEKFVDGTVASKTILSKSYKIPSGRRDPNEMIKDSLPIWEEVKKDFLYALDNARTVVVDTETEQWELIRLARLGRLEQVKPHHYGPVNREYKETFIKASYESNANVIFLQRLKKEYINDKTTGRYEQAGFSGIPFDVQVNCRTFIDDQGQFSLFIDNCRQNGLLRGTFLTGDILNFPTLAMMVLPSLPPEVWL